MTTPKKAGRHLDIVFWLSIKDLIHEKILSICLICAITAVVTPLMLVFGLKFGIIDWAGDYLKGDPRYREIRPRDNLSLDQEWFDAMETLPEIRFIVPMTRQLSATVSARLKDQEGYTELNVIPTKEGDPLLLENGAPIPKGRELVLSYYAADTMKAKAEDTLVIRASRVRGGNFEYATVEMKVAGVLAPRATALKSIYVDLEILEAVERYKDGRAVTEFGWSGETPKAYPVYDGLMVMVPEKLSKIKELGMTNRTGFTKVEGLDSEALYRQARFRVSPEVSVYHLYTQQKPVEDASIRSVKDRFRGQVAGFVPVISPISVGIRDAEGGEETMLSLYGLSVEPEDIEPFGISFVPPWKTEFDSTTDAMRIVLPENVLPDAERVVVRMEQEEGLLTFSLTVAGRHTLDADTVFVPGFLAGKLNLSERRKIEFDEDLGEFVLFRQGYPGFRAYTANIDQVDEMRKYFEAKSIFVYTELEDINKVKQLDRGMSLLFKILAAVGIAGCLASLTASLYASVERKKRELGVLRLIGFSGIKLWKFPIYQGMVIGSIGFFVSLGLFLSIAVLVNNWFRPYVERLLPFGLEESVSFCRLPPLHILGVLSAILLFAFTSALIAVYRIGKIEPSEALRDE